MVHKTPSLLFGLATALIVMAVILGMVWVVVELFPVNIQILPARTLKTSLPSIVQWANAPVAK